MTREYHPPPAPVRPPAAPPPPARIAVIVDCMSLARFQREALSTVAAGASILVLNCRNTGHRRRPIAHGLYYLLNLLAIRNDWSRAVPLPAAALEPEQVIDFEAEGDGVWQSLPDAVVAAVNAFRPDFVIKFGMGLLRIPSALEAPILSWHHGDPARYRGRPAGFYETMNREPVMGQVIQVLSDRLDSGRVLAFAETKVHGHSYRATMREAYRHSPYLLAEAVRNLRERAELPIRPDGRNYRLPSNLTVLRFAARMGWQALKRLFYGALVVKIWDVAAAPLRPDAGAGGIALPGRERWRVLPREPGFTFYADPFFRPGSSEIMVEALRRFSGRGEILNVGPAGTKRLLASRRHHFSYPATVEQDGETFLVPEVATWSTPLIYRFTADGLIDAGPLVVKGVTGLLDPTLYRQDGLLYLFANDIGIGTDALFLWTADSLFADFEPHPMSPVRISPRGARMAGGLFCRDNRLFRPGQDGSRTYGDGILLYEVERLGPDVYAERPAGELRFDGVKGPHTLNLDGDSAVFDFYVDRLSLLAGLRRLRSRGA